MAEVVDPRQESLKYLEKHKVPLLFEMLGAKLAFYKPDDPNAFLLKELNRIAECKKKGEPVTLMTEEDLVTMFSIFDITGRGYVNQVQYRKALEAIGINSDDENVKIPKSNTIDRVTFVKFLKSEMLRRSI